MNEKASITVLEAGGYVSFANCGMPYYLAGRIADESKLLVTTVPRLRERFNIDALVHHEVVRIDRQARIVEAINHTQGTMLRFPYDKLILAMGANAIVPPVENVNAPNVFLMRSMEDTQAMHRHLAERKPKKAVIVGAGFIGLELAEALRERGLEVSVIEKAAHALPLLDPEIARPIESELKANGVTLVAGTGLKALHATNGLVDKVECDNGMMVPADVVVLSIGVRPNARLAVEAGLKIGPSGAVAVDEHQRSSDPDIYAVGDVSEAIHGVTLKSARIPLAGPANRQGRLAGEHAATGNSAPAARLLGTAIVQVFGLSVGMTGMSETAARAAGIEVDSALVLPAHHATYYPGASTLRLKLVYEAKSGRIIGAQAVGKAGVDKRIDVIATAIHFRGTIDDLADLDLAYAPQFGSAKDPIHVAAFVAQNQLRGLVHGISMDQVGDRQIVDVRTPAEAASGTLPGAINIPVDELRQRLHELDSRRPTVVLCQIGLRGYVACRILQQNGFEQVFNLKGGWAGTQS